MVERSGKWVELCNAWENVVNLAMSGKVGIKMMRCLAQLTQQGHHTMNTFSIFYSVCVPFMDMDT